MKRKTARKITAIWDRINSDEPDISTEQLFARTADEASRLFGWEVDNGHIGEALSMLREETPA